MKRLFIIDAHAVIHRAYHALPPLKTKKGEIVNAVYGFLLVFFRAIKDLKPDYIAACFDRPEPTFRHKEFKDYKAQRPKTPDELASQIPKVKEVLETFSVPVFEKQGFEADDILATIAKKIKNQKSKIKNNDEQIETIILTGDLDILQLVNENIKVCVLKKGVKDMVLYDEEGVKKRYGLSPAQLVDYKALVGDPSDNIPGVPGIGPKTATKLLQEFGSLEGIYEGIGPTPHQFCEKKKNGDALSFGKAYSAPAVAGTKDGKIGAGQVGPTPHQFCKDLLRRRPLPRNRYSRPAVAGTKDGKIGTGQVGPISKAGPILKEYREQAFLSKKLAQLRVDVSLELDLKKCELEYNKEKAIAMLKELGFESLVERLPEKDSPEEKKGSGRLF